MKIEGLHMFCLTLFTITIINVSHASRLSQLNKNILNSIKSEDGDVIDCVDVLRQPAFDHPLLKNHMIKMKPSYHPDGLFSEKKMSNFNSKTASKKSPITQTWQLSGNCPHGTIPVRRPGKQDLLLRASSITKTNSHITPQGSSSSGISSVDHSIHEYAYSLTTGKDKYHGTKAIISVRQPHVEGSNEFSLSQLWIVGGRGSNVNTIEVGWIVYPQFLGDNRTRLFIYWTTDSYKSSGCYNLGCPGFVQINNQIAIGGSISTQPDSEITLLVWKDQKAKVWWLQYNGSILGYWPTKIFNALNDTASVIEWGGEIINSNISGIHTGTQMGSGQFPANKFKASYFRNLEITTYQSMSLRSAGNISGNAGHPNCYNISVGLNKEWGNFFFYGGPGRNPKCYFT